MSRVLITAFCGVPGPHRAGIQLRQVVRALTPAHSVDVLALREGDQPYVEKLGSVRVLRVPVHDPDPAVHVRAFQRALKRQLEGADYQIVHCRDPWSCQTVLEARSHLDVAIIYDLARSPEPLDASWSPTFAEDEDSSIRAADLVLVPTQHAARVMSRSGGHFAVTPPGVDIDRFDWDDLGAGQGRRRVLYAGSVSSGRGLRTLVQAMATVNASVDAELVIAGRCAAGFDVELRELARKLQIEDRLQLLGQVEHEQIPALIATATVCVAPSVTDLQTRPAAPPPTKLLEYLACRRPVVAARRGAVGLIAEDGRQALLYEPGNHADLARALLALLQDSALADRLAVSGYNRVRREATASGARRSVRAAYGELMRRFPARFESVGDPAARPPESVSDDDFEATALEDAAALAPDTGVEAGFLLGSERVLEPETFIRSRRRRALSHTNSSIAPPPLPAGWVGAPLGELAAASEDEGTPLEGITGVSVTGGSGATSLTATLGDNRFVAGEIDVPAPVSGTIDISDISELTPAGSIVAEREPDTGETSA